MPDTIKIAGYRDCYKEQIIKLILDIQNKEAGINLSLEEQPDLNDIQMSYMEGGGYFWMALNEKQEVVGTIGLMRKMEGVGILKKFFVHKDCRRQGVGFRLYSTLLAFCVSHNFKILLLDTPAVAEDSHKFYERNGFARIHKSELPIPYEFPDRNSFLYIKWLRENSCFL